MWRTVLRESNRTRRPDRIEGLARHRQIIATAGSRILLARAATLRPSITRPDVSDVGYRIGRSLGVACWASRGLDPPPGSARSGTGTSIVIPMILDAPGAVVTTSTRPDNLAVTLAARQQRGPVAVFDPRGLADGPGSIRSLRWSVVGGCERPRTAMLRAEALVPPIGRSGVANGTFWRQQALSVVRFLLYAAALDRRPPKEIYRWSHDPFPMKGIIGCAVVLIA